MAKRRMTDNKIEALLPDGNGHQFIIYSDSCSGVPGALHAHTFASVNTVLSRIEPRPNFILFPGDEIIGLVESEEALRKQWRFWLDHEMSWLDRTRIPIWHTTGNHTTYDEMSEGVFRDVLELPCNGPKGQEGLSYFVRREDLLLIFINTLWSGLGGEGHVETEWLEQTLEQHQDARHKLVVGHHPVFGVNGYRGPYCRELGYEYRDKLWTIFARHRVAAYVCSHILAFDVQAYRGVLQICSAGAGTAHRMPDGVEYLHLVQAALDKNGLRYQVLDIGGDVREKLKWPLSCPAPSDWRLLQQDRIVSPFSSGANPDHNLFLHLQLASLNCLTSAAQTVFSAFHESTLATIWLGLRGPSQTLTLIAAKNHGRSPAYWIGPDLAGNRNIDLQIAICPDMGPGGVLWRHANTESWSSFETASVAGLTASAWPQNWVIGHGQRGARDRPLLAESYTVHAALMP